MKRNLLITALLAAGISSAALAQEPVDAEMNKRFREIGLNNSQVMDIAFNLTDVSGPRLANSPGLKRAQEYAANLLKTWGMVNVKLEPWGKFGKGWEVKKNYAAITAPYYHAIIAIPKAWTPSTNGAISGDVVLLKVDTVTDLEKYKGKLAGKIVMMETAGLPPERAQRNDFSRYTDEQLAEMAKATMEPPRGQGGPRRGGPNAQMAAFRRIMAIRQQLSTFYVNEKVALVLSQGRGSDGTVFTSNGASYADTAKAVAPELETSTEDYQRILRLVKAGKKVNMEADIKTEFYTNDLDGYNVVGEIPGTDKKLKEEVVMIGGHLDSWHAATGATDNAAGSAVMLEAMRILSRSGWKPKRTIRIALWSSEEQGLFGSRGYVAKHFGDRNTMKLLPEQSKLSAYYNLDNGTGKIRGIYLQGDSAARDIFQAWLDPFKDLGAGTVTIRNTGGTDHQAFDALGMPGFQFIQDEMDYNTRTHHSNQDTYDRLVAADLKQAATIVASFVYHTSQRKDMIPRKPLPAPPTTVQGR